MTHKLVRIQIHDDASLLEACDLLHDARCDLSTYKFDEENGIWQATFEREFFEDSNLVKSEPRFIILKKHTFPLAESVLTIKGVKNCEIRDKSNIGIYTFNECEIKDNIYMFLFCEDMEMLLTFISKPEGSLIDKRLLDTKSSIYSFRNLFRKNKKLRT